jgi:rhodanese-related sulfurtransferase
MHSTTFWPSSLFFLTLLGLFMLGRVSAFAIHHHHHHHGTALIFKHSSTRATTFAVRSLRQQEKQESLRLLVERAMSSTSSSNRKGGVASPEELKDFVQKAGDRLVVIDVRNPDASAEPGDQKSLAVAALPSTPDFRPRAIHLIWDRSTSSMPLPSSSEVSALDTPIITHCGGGGRGQLAKDFLESKGYTSVMNGGGPKEKECWAEFGDK